MTDTARRILGFSRKVRAKIEALPTDNRGSSEWARGLECGRKDAIIALLKATENAIAGDGTEGTE